MYSLGYVDPGLIGASDFQVRNEAPEPRHAVVDVAAKPRQLIESDRWMRQHSGHSRRRSFRKIFLVQESSLPLASHGYPFSDRDSI